MAENLTQEISFHYLKVPSYRTYHVDGFFGGITPRGGVYIETFVERAVTPQVITHEIDPNGKLGEETNREGKDGVIREIECGIAMDINAARLCRDWLTEKLNEYDEAKKKEEK